MKTIVTITNLYTINELPKKVQNAIFDKWRAEGEYPYFDDYVTLIDNLCECFHIQATIKKIDGYRYVDNIEFWDNKVLKMLQAETYDYVKKCYEEFSSETKKSGNGIFTISLYEYLLAYLDMSFGNTRKINLTNMLWGALSFVTQKLNKDIDRYYSFDSFLDDCEQNNRYFTIDGDEYEE